jgi:hypothetical protein
VKKGPREAPAQQGKQHTRPRIAALHAPVLARLLVGDEEEEGIEEESPPPTPPPPPLLLGALRFDWSDIR